MRATEARISRMAALTVIAVLGVCACGGAAATNKPMPAGSRGAVPEPGAITTLCGDDSAGWNGDGLPARETRLSYPVAIAFDREGRLVIVESGSHRVRRIEKDGLVRTILGSEGGPHHAHRATEQPEDEDHAAQSGHGDHGDHGAHSEGSVAPGTPRPHHPFGVAVALDGALLVAGNLDPRIYRIAADGGVMTIAGGDSAGFRGDNGPALLALLDAPLGVAVAPDGAILVADAGNHRVRRIDPDGTIATVAGSGEQGYSGDGGPATAARLNAPFRVAVDPRDGSFLIADSGNNAIRRVDASGTIKTIAGKGEPGLSGDGGPATAARLKAPEEARPGPDGAIYIADSGNHRVRRIRSDGTIETVAGGGLPSARGPAADGDDARSAVLRHPSGLAFDPHGDLVIAESYGHRVRLVRLQRGG